VRISGTNRYATAVAASKHAFPNGAPIVYIAVGNNYPDALTGGAATAVYKGPILLVTTTAIPAIVATELRRLGPLRIVILGGPAVVSTNVASQLSAYLP
jgi:putative cell wall-binding protein